MTHSLPWRLISAEPEEGWHKELEQQLVSHDRVF